MIDLDDVVAAWRLHERNYYLLRDEVEELINRLRQAEKDAARYRWLRDIGCFEGSYDDLFHATPSETDAEFDRFMQCSK